ncbi:hypothetical protein [Dyadobacter sandarakinus]|uniref:Uncharacterized protein n=1 Tax=Dyadobacter sandarakinus TaxID=2747268 RepID=A0ABX7I210_9BACT|nr:hypothetical protein [Dyadobacter sandarakinus]QRR00109.1 hypothetical protein HWI92_03870 [Dyadobacter sandarakinus]
MKIGDKLLKELSKKYQPDSMINSRFERYDLAFKTDSEGNPILLFIGTLKPDGQVRGNRFVRNIIRDASGKVLKDHWDHKGRT